MAKSVILWVRREHARRYASQGLSTGAAVTSSISLVLAVLLLLGDLGMARLADVPWSPLADVSETDDAYLVHVELPGIRKDQIDVQLQDRQLIVSGEIKETENGRRHRSSRRAGRFEYRTYLPGDVKADQVSAQLTDGVLTVTVPKSEAAKPRKIEIKG